MSSKKNIEEDEERESNQLEVKEKIKYDKFHHECKICGLHFYNLQWRENWRNFCIHHTDCVLAHKCKRHIFR